MITADEKEAHKKAAEKYAHQAIPPKSFAQKHKSHGHHHKHSKKAKDVFDHDHDTTSPYDDASNVNGGSPYNKAIASDAPVEGPGIKETEAAIGKALKERKAKKDFDASGVPELPGEIVRKEAASDSATAFAGAIPAKKDGSLDTDAKGAEAQSAGEAQQKEEADAKAVEEEEKGGKEAKALADKVVKELDEKDADKAAEVAENKAAAEKKEKEEKKEVKAVTAAFAQKKHHKRHHHKKH